MKETSELRNQLKAIRTRLGLSQQDLAATASVARQTIGGIEAELYAPSAIVALRISKALGCRVEDVFWLDDADTVVEAVVAEGTPSESPIRVAMASVAGRWIAHPLHGAAAFRSELAPADGVATQVLGTSSGSTNGSQMLRVRLLDEPETLARTVVIAGCTPVLSLWARSAERWNPNLRVHWTHANSTVALTSLARGQVHAAGMHLWDAATGEFNAPFVREALPGRAVALVNLGTWEEGLVVASGNPKVIVSVTDLAKPGVRMVNRELGAGSRLLLDSFLQADGVTRDSVAGYDCIVRSHQAAAAEVASGAADVGITTAAVAGIYGLGFVPLRRVCYDLAFLTETLEEEPVRHLLATLGHRWVRTQFEVLGGYDTARTGDITLIDP